MWVRGRPMIPASWFRLGHTYYHFFTGCFRSRTPGTTAYRFVSVALAVLPSAAFPAAVGFKAFAGSTECASATFVRRTPGCSPLVNSTPAASSASCSRSILARFRPPLRPREGCDQPAVTPIPWVNSVTGVAQE